MLHLNRFLERGGKLNEFGGRHFFRFSNGLELFWDGSFKDCKEHALKLCRFFNCHAELLN